MFLWGFLLFLSGFLQSGRCDTNQVLEKCIEYVLCQEEDGLDKSELCIKKLSDRDINFIIESFQQFYDGIETLRDLGLRACAGPFELGKKAVYNYYDEIFQRDLKEFQPVQDKKKMVEARECLFEMVNSCKEKHEMGLID